MSVIFLKSFPQLQYDNYSLRVAWNHDHITRGSQHSQVIKYITMAHEDKWFQQLSRIYVVLVRPRRRLRNSRKTNVLLYESIQ